jgi:hypothetical protein
MNFGLYIGSAASGSMAGSNLLGHADIRFQIKAQSMNMHKHTFYAAQHLSTQELIVSSWITVSCSTC